MSITPNAVMLADELGWRLPNGPSVYALSTIFDGVDFRVDVALDGGIPGCLISKNYWSIRKSENLGELCDHWVIYG
ncbi:hypothetical protein [Brevundimonas nasdae]|uniref:Uncharacterized protein n=1 Tax=Brevundimonas nasdae TaxID=172043 RepID=A0ACD4VKN0_9CAUL|nr:hypothetical protein [Brevundimonas nasdae]WOB78462.1 hypothetical protein PZA08_14330 [Brevundimonas nasdae]